MWDLTKVLQLSRRALNSKQETVVRSFLADIEKLIGLSIFRFCKINLTLRLGYNVIYNVNTRSRR